MPLDRRSLAIALALAALAIAFFGLRPKPTGGPPMRDFESYWAAGKVSAAGGNPYSREVWRYQRTIAGVVATRDELLPFVGPPYGLPFWSLLARFPFEGAIWIWGAVLAVSIATIAFGSLALSGRAFDRLDVVATATLCAAFGPLTSGVGLGQVAIVSTAAVIACVLVARRNTLGRETAPHLRMGPLGLAAGAFVAALQPNLALALTPLLSRARALPLAIAAVAALSVATLQRFGSMRDYLGLLHEHGRAEQFIAIQTTIAGVARGFGAAPDLSLAASYLATAAVVVIAAVQCLARERPLAERVAIACAAVPIALPFSHEHDFTIVFFPAVYAIRMARGPAFEIACAGTLLVAVDWLGLAQRPTGVAETACFAVAAVFALGVLAPRANAEAAGFAAALRGVLERAGVCAIAPAILVLGALAHRLPTWPDALSRTYRASADASVTAVWLDEQTRSGIAALDPWWAALRALSLIGCAVVWYAVVRAGQEARTARAPVSRPAVPASEAVLPNFSPLSTRPQPVAEVCPSSSRTP